MLLGNVARTTVVVVIAVCVCLDAGDTVAQPAGGAPRGRAAPQSGGAHRGHLAAPLPHRPAARPSSTPHPVVSPSVVHGAGANIDVNLSSNLAAAMTTLHLRTVRDAHDDPDLASHLEQMEAAGIQPLIVMYGCSVSDAHRLADNRFLLQRVHRIFGDASIWWELGNENDLQCGLTARQYTAMWNGEIPALRNMYPHDWFGGPVTFQANPSFIAYFVAHASPGPDFISWHEYTCSSADSARTCIDNVARWPAHIATTRQRISAEGLSAPPVFITEWNYAPDGGVASDGKHGNATFMNQWTTMALRTLAENDVAESYQFDTSGVLPLVDSRGTATAQGVAFSGFWGSR